MIKLPVQGIMDFWNSRTGREKNLIVALLICFAVFLDYLLFIRPVQAIYADTLPRLGMLKKELRGLKEDRKNKDGIEKDWMAAKEKLAEAEARFVSWDEMSMTLDRVSQLAQSSGVKIMSLAPVEAKSARTQSLYRPIPIVVSGLGGTHAIGKFLEKLETNHTFFRVTTMRIAENPSDVKRHLLELRVEALRRGAA